MAPITTAIIETTTFTSFDSILGKNTYVKDESFDESYDTPKGMIGAALKERVEAIDHETCEADEENTFFVADLGEVYRQHMRWKKNLPRIKPFYGTFLPSKDRI
jgi:ornithine decarboxylase